MSRPMPSAARLDLVAQYRGRRRALAQAVHNYVTVHERDYSIAWEQWTRRDVEREVCGRDYGLWQTRPQCLCEEDWLQDLLWAMVSNDPMLPDYDFRHGTRGPVLPPAK